MAPAVGLRVGVGNTFQKALSCRTACAFCSQAIPVGAWRLDFRFKAVTKLSERKWLHVECLGEVPEEFRDVSIKHVEDWLRRGDFPTRTHRQKLLQGLRLLRGCAAIDQERSAPSCRAK